LEICSTESRKLGASLVGADLKVGPNGIKA
jgi:hypothetical protein